MKLLGILVAAGCAAMATACCITYDDIAMKLAEERAIVVWDQESKVEHFIRASTFKGSSKDFGFIFPSPTEPHEIEVADAEAFTTLYRAKPIPQSIGCSAGSDAAAGETAKSGVEVLQQKTVGDFKVTVLRAEDGSAMAGWLKTNGHQMRDAMVPWLDFYAKKSWCFTAFKYQGSVAGKETKAVRISFKAEKPHYPYKMPSDTWEPGHHRKLSLFVVSQSPMKGVHSDGKSWPTEEAWHNSLTNYAQEALSTQIGKENSPLILPAGLFVTQFENSPAATNYEQDLTFEPNPDRPWWPVYLGVAIIMLIFRKVWRDRAANRSHLAN